MKKPLNIVIYLDDPGVYDYPFTQEKYLTSYYELSEKIKNRGANCFIARSPKSYDAKSVFKKTYRFSEKGVLEESGEVVADVVFDKGDKDTFRFTDAKKLINPRYINEICFDKDKTYKLFPQFSPKSVLAQNYGEAASARATFGAEKKVVVKPYSGFEGVGVQIVKPEDDLEIDQQHYPVIVQEFIDSSGGVEGLIEGVHELRLVIMNGDIVMSFFRTPPEGSLLVNVSQGGKLHFVPAEDLPASALEIAKLVDEHFNEQGDRAYSVDMAFDSSGDARLIELNSRPAMWPSSYHTQAEQYQNRLADLLTA